MSCEFASALTGFFSYPSSCIPRAPSYKPTHKRCREEAAIAIYHLTVRTGTRAKGTVAAKKSDYIQRENQYEQQPDLCIYKESDHMPSWAQEEPRDYWQAADQYERANGRLFVEVEFALPRELSEEEQINLAHDFAQDLTHDSSLPYTLAVHEGYGENPHAHLIISERMNDGIERDPDEWFSRANSLEPEQGGAMKSNEFQFREHIYDIREHWADLANERLEQEGSLERIDHRSLEAQGIEREPTQHIGPVSKHMEERGLVSDRLAELAYDQQRESDLEGRLAYVNGEIKLEQEHAREIEREHDYGYDLGL